MQKATLRKKYPVGALISFSVLGLLLWFTYGLLFAAPYAGFFFNPSDGEILKLYVKAEPERTLKTGDFIQRIGSTTWGMFHADRNLNFFENVQKDQIIEVVVQRGEESIAVPWVYPGITPIEFADRFVNIWWLAYAFWYFGMATQLFMRPKDARWGLLIAANYLTALFIILGSFSAWHIWKSSVLFHATTWLAAPVYLHFHWNFPKPLRKLPVLLWGVIYAVSFILAVGEWFQVMPRSFYLLGVLLMLVGSLALLIVHYIQQPEQRRELLQLARAVLIAIIPIIVTSLLSLEGSIPAAGPLALAALAIMPGTYFYVIYRRRPGGLELRTNRIISVYAFLILLTTVMLTLTGYVGALNISSETMIFIALVATLFTALLSILGFPAFQRFIEQHILGIKLPYQDLPEIYSARITTSARIPDLLKLLEEEVFPSLLVKQYAFVRLAKSSATVLLSKNVTSDQLQEEALTELLASVRTHDRLPLWEEGQPLDWIRLILPLQVDSEVLGAWLLGRRDPDDLYPQTELPIFQSLADQTSIALSNLLQTERLRKMYEDDIERNEKSRHQLALDLHDSVLHQLAILRLNVDESSVSQKFQEAYEEVTSRLREIVTDLRPPMLGYGLQFAIEELADNLMERSKDTLKVEANVQAKGEARYPESIERHIFRIMQEACENAVRHGHATQINILAKLGPSSIYLLIQDNGIGFQIPRGADLDTLLANRHFGLAGMVERAMLIGAKVDIDSYPKAGARIQISWAEAEINAASSNNATQ